MEPEQNTNWRNLLARIKVHKILVVIVSAVLLILLGTLSVFWKLPTAQEIKDFNVQSTVLSFENFNWETRGDEPIRKAVPLSAIAEILQKAVIISEDDTFWQHEGVNFQMMKEAWKINWERGRYARGASTITMQLARNAFLSKEKTLIRKIREIIVARRMEKVLTKKQIFELYLNVIEWGENIYGAEAAAQYHFGMSARDVTLAEATMLTGILPNPKRFSPFRRMETARKFQKRVLDLLVISKVIDQETAAAAFATPIVLRGQEIPVPPLLDSLLAIQPRTEERDTLLNATPPDSLAPSDSVSAGLDSQN
jgi:monofunctional biosynthetic peptidoglycan transglycosylase